MRSSDETSSDIPLTDLPNDVLKEIINDLKNDINVLKDYICKREFMYGKKMDSLDKAILNTILSVAFTCKKLQEISFNQEFYKDRYLEKFQDRWLRFVPAKENSLGNTLSKTFSSNLDSAAKSGCRTGNAFIGTSGSILGTAIGIFAGSLFGAANVLVKLSTLDFRTAEELEHLKIFLNCTPYTNKSREIIIKTIVARYHHYKMQQRLQNPEDSKPEPYLICTSNSSNHLLEILISKRDINRKWQSLTDYMTAKNSEDEIKNNGRAFFNIIYAVLKENCPLTIEARKEIINIKKLSNTANVFHDGSKRF